jgi:hypothetical protein
MRSILVRIGAALVLAAGLGRAALPAAAGQVAEGPRLVVWNPNAGDRLRPGALSLQGLAFDPAASVGTGVDRVSVFLGDRDAGGRHLGDAMLGTFDRLASAPAHAGWTLITPALRAAGEGRVLFVYARSSLTGREAVVQIPIFIGERTPSRGSGVATPPEIPPGCIVQPRPACVPPAAGGSVPSPMPTS